MKMRNEVLREAQRSAYLILIETIADRQTLQTIERKYEKLSRRW